MTAFGFAFIPRGPFDEVTALVQQAEAWGYRQAWIPDQTFYRDPFVVLTACALATRTINLGLSVVNPFTRHPVQVARAIATYDEISKGRTVLGIGAGNRKELLVPMGLEYKEPTIRIREMIRLSRRLWSGEKVYYEGAGWTLNGVKLQIDARPNIPIYVATRGPETLKMSAELADGIIIGEYVSPEGLDFAFSHINKGLKAAGRSRESLYVVSWVLFQITEDKEKTLQVMKPWVAHMIGGASDDILRSIGMRDEVVAKVKEAYAKGGPEGGAPYVTEDEIGRVTNIGTLEECAAKVGVQVARGVDQVVLLLVSPTLQQVRDTLEIFAQKIMPRYTS